ncbi:ThuA domain-containing protein [bacterium]|nr:ThuA domain-containing protein [bacterium]
MPICSGQPEIEFKVTHQSGNTAPRPRSVFFFSQQNNGHHNPATFIALTRRPFGERDIQFTSKSQTADLTALNFAPHDALFFGWNYNFIPLDAQNDILSFVRSGKGAVGMHVATYSFRNIPNLRGMIGGSFRGHHAFQEFSQTLIQSNNTLPPDLESHPDFPFEAGETYSLDFDHPIIRNLQSYTSVDEPYLLNFMSPDITLLGFRNDYASDGTLNWSEPYTWVRNEDSGRVFYHANGHDARTWDQPNFQELMIRGIHYASGVDNGQSYTNLSAPILNPDGSLQFLSTISRDGSALLGLYSSEKQTSIQNGQVPGPNEELLFDLSPSIAHSIAENGTVALSPTLKAAGSTLGPALLVGPANYPHLIAYSSGPADPIEAGFQFSPSQNYPFQLNQTGQTLFYALIEDSAGGNQKAALALTDSGGTEIATVILEGDPFPENPSTTVVNLDSQLFSLSDDGQIALISSTLDDPSTSHLIAGEIGSLTTFVQTGTPSLGLPPNTVIDEFLKIGSVRNDSLTFFARLQGASITSANDQVVLTASPDGSVVLRLQEGDLIGGQIVSFPTNGKFFDRDLASILEVTLDSSPALLSLPKASPAKILLKVGQIIQADGLDWNVINLQLSETMTNGHHLVVPSTLSQVGAPSITKAALLSHSSVGPRVIAMEGWILPTETDDLEIAELSCHSGEQETSGVNASGMLAFKITATNGATALVTVANLEDLDQDSLNDALELAFGGNLDLTDSSPPPGYPAKVTMPDGSWRLSYWQPSPGTTSIGVQPEFSHDLIDWFPYSGTVINDPNQAGVTNGYERQITDIPTSGDQPYFFRLKVHSVQ